MKRIFLLGAMVCLLGLTSCTSHLHTVSPKGFRKEIWSVNNTIESYGYKLSGTYSDTKCCNDSYWYDTYNFRDSVGNIVSYQMKYRYSKDSYDSVFVTDISVLGCECSNTKDYDSVCGPYGVTQGISRPKPDQVSTFGLSEATAASLIILITVIAAAGVGTIVVTAL